MQVSKIVPGCYHLQAGQNKALFGSPPEILKFVLRAGKEVPAVGILPDIAYVNGVSQIALEFPAYWFMFVQRADEQNRRFRIIGTAEMCRRVKEILNITLFGPTRQQMRKWKLSKTRIEMLAKMMDYFAPKRNGVPKKLEDIFEFVHFPEKLENGIALFPHDALMIWRLGNNRFAVGTGRRRKTIDLNFEGEQLPILANPADEIELPQVLRVKLLGSYSGFDASGPTTGMVLWINCNGFLVDGPVGTSSYLRRLGIPKADLRGTILSHVHDDHCTLMDMIISEQTANIITAREIYESMLIKVANVLGESTDQMRNYLTFTEVVPGKKINMYGATWEFFYAVHSIPTVGFRVSVRGFDGRDHTVLHTSDTVHFDGLEKMGRERVISPAHEAQMKALVRGGERLAIIDAGGPPLHGVHTDFHSAIEKNPDTDFLFYHVSPDKISDKRCQVATAGWGKTLIAGQSMPQALVLKLLKTLKLLEVSDLTWINILLSQGQLVEIPPGVDVVSQGHMGDNFYFVLAGSQHVFDGDRNGRRVLAVLEPGDFFGETSIIRNARRNATVRTLSASILFRLPGRLFLEFVKANGLKQKFERIWLSRPIISEVAIFNNLHPHAKYEIGLLAEERVFGRGEFIIRQGGKADDFYIIRRGRAQVVKRAKAGRQTVITHLGRGDFFGENVAMGYRVRRNASVVATSQKLETLKILGKHLRRLAESAPVLRHELHLVMQQRGMTSIPVTPRESYRPTPFHPSPFPQGGDR